MHLGHQCRDPGRVVGDLTPVSPRTDGDVHLGHGHALPATPELVAVFLAELGEEGKSVATLRLTKSALAAVHRSPRPH